MINADLAIAHAIGDLLTARKTIADALTSRGFYYGNRPRNEEEIDLLNIYERLTATLEYVERKRKALEGGN